MTDRVAASERILGCFGGGGNVKDLYTIGIRFRNLLI